MSIFKRSSERSPPQVLPMLQSTELEVLERRIDLICFNHLHEWGKADYNAHNQEMIHGFREILNGLVSSVRERPEIVSSEMAIRRTSFREALATLHSGMTWSALVNIEKMLKSIEKSVSLLPQGVSEQMTTGGPSLVDSNKGVSQSDFRAGKALEAPTSITPQTQQNPFAFEATIVFFPKGTSQGSKIHCRGQMDTGSTENWISRRVIASTHLEYTMKTLVDPKAYQAFGGDTFFPIGHVEVQWYLEDEARTRKSTFLVGDEVPFDMVVGSVLIQQEDLLARKAAVLGVRVVEPTEEELTRMEREAMEGERSRDQLAAIRDAQRARAAEERRRLRESAAASAQSNSALTPSTSTTTNPATPSASSETPDMYAGSSGRPAAGSS